jgi:D-lactate dehydrogenase
MKMMMYGVRDDERPFIEQWQEQNHIDVQLTDQLLTEETVDQARGYDGIVAFQQLSYSNRMLQRMAEIGIYNLSLRNVGVDNIDLKQVAKLGIKLTNVPVYSPEAIAEFTVTQLMQLLRRTKEYTQKFEKHDFRWAPQISKELNQQTVGVIGTGHIGQCAIRIFQGFGAKVIAYDKFHNPELERQGLYVDTLDELYRQATVITLHIPLFPSTQHMIDATAIAKMNPGVIILNAARGQLIDEQALIDGLDRGIIGGAALDVMEDEIKVFNRNLGDQKIDYPEFNNLFNRDNVLISPHTAFYTDVAVRNMVEVSLNNNRQLIETGTADNLISTD